MLHIVVIPYYCDEEVNRFLRIADLLVTWPAQHVDYEFLLVASGSTEPSDHLRQAFSRVGPVRHHQCRALGQGHAEGSLSMFWDAMQFVCDEYAHDGGFALWLESDMVPVRQDWLDALAAEWTAEPNLTVMGLLLTRLPDFLGGASLPEHINGGACYGRNLVDYVPSVERTAPFDAFLLRSVKQHGGRYNTSDLFALASVATADRHIGKRAILHGLAQPKCEFVEHCVRLAASAS